MLYYDGDASLLKFFDTIFVLKDALYYFYLFIHKIPMFYEEKPLLLWWVTLVVIFSFNSEYFESYISSKIIVIVQEYE